jgi:hypothetical protein
MGGHPDPHQLSQFDSLEDVERREVLRHVAACGACRSVWVEADPSRVFALLGADAMPETALDRLTAGINDEIDAVETVSVGRRPGFGWASLAASVMLAAAIGGYLVSRPDVVSRASVAEAVATQHDQFAGSGIEVMTPAGADVYDLTVGDTQIVMIFDERLDI